LLPELKERQIARVLFVERKRAQMAGWQEAEVTHFARPSSSGLESIADMVILAEEP
jgi:hypothetical protein